MTLKERESAIENRINQPGFKLIGGIYIISKLFPGSTVTAIQFEDGSHKKFNYQLNGGKWQFIDLSHYQFI